MTALLSGARRLVTRGGTDLGARVEALHEAVAAAHGRLDEALVAGAAATADRAAARLGLSADHTVVALAGATGSGKSSTYNALTGLELAAVGVRRPTTSATAACVWGAADAAELLDWLGVPERHRSLRDSTLDERHEDHRLDGVVLLDLPDHDSTEVEHHLEVDRLVELTDLLVWVLDPQKYADAAIHDRYLAPLSSHRDVMVVTLNHVDTVPEGDREAMLADVRRRLADDGLPDVPVIATSARHGQGVDDLRAEIAGRVRDKRATRARVDADLRSQAARLGDAAGEGRPRSLSRGRVAELEDALADAAGVPVVVRAVEQSTRARAGRATGWPVTAWLGRLRPDPLRRLHLGPSERSDRAARSSLPASSPLQRARVDAAVRDLAHDAAQGLARPWTDAVRRASVSRSEELADRLDLAVSGPDLGSTGVPWWARGVRALQWLLLLTAMAGLGWLVTLAGAGFLGVPAPRTPTVEGLPVPTVLLLGGVLLGVGLALVSRLLVGLTARSRGRAAERTLRAAVEQVATELVVDPVEAELAAHTALREALQAVRRA